MDAILARIPDRGRYYLTIDADGVDPTVMPAVAGPALSRITCITAGRLIMNLIGAAVRANYFD